MSTNTFAPAVWAQQIAGDMIESMRRSDELLYGPEELRRQGHTVSTPYTPEELAQRTAKLAIWQKLTDELLAAGQLDHDSCYECGGELTPVTDTDRHEYVWDETDEEHHARTAGMPAHDDIAIAFIKTRINIGRD